MLILFPFGHYSVWHTTIYYVWLKEKAQNDKQQTTKHTLKTTHQVTRNPLKSGMNSWSISDTSRAFFLAKIQMIMLKPFARNGYSIVSCIYGSRLIRYWSKKYILAKQTNTSWSYTSWIYNSLWNQCLSPLMLWVLAPFVTKRTRYSIMWKNWSVTGLWFSLGILVSSTNATERHNITEILLKVALNTIKQLLYL
jgi:hypothetical protein